MEQESDGSALMLPVEYENKVGKDSSCSHVSPELVLSEAYQTKNVRKFPDLINILSHLIHSFAIPLLINVYDCF